VLEKCKRIYAVMFVDYNDSGKLSVYVAGAYSSNNMDLRG